MSKETMRSVTAGGSMVFVHLAGLAGAWALSMHAATAARAGEPQPALVVGAVALFGLCVLGMRGFFVVNPNEAQVLQLFGHYVGTARQPGLRWTNPFYTRVKVSERVVSLQTEHLKVNDLDGNPIEIAAIIVWKVTDTAKATFDVDDYRRYVLIQSEAALRNLATRYSYDSHDEGHSLRGSTSQVVEHLQKEVQERVALAGVSIIEARISHLAYAPEIAQAMLQRQQASAIIAARQRIVDGAVGMVEMALARLARNNVVTLDEERKAQMVSNLLVVLCGERATQPVINTGTIYQ